MIKPYADPDKVMDGSITPTGGYGYFRVSGREKSATPRIFVQNLLTPQNETNKYL